ncbi:hypothetical protein QBC38DRAFT_484587 [Podospora fimiseda]|uniref:Uncharacterized protein n=1 Tax=Podospora fimiseda TaxID=252190 RepID=A0AAN7BKA2_9PEZI|nr:hypothetical protein QBC38DRAFT_484587 [Podospora fimiseda]
MDPIAAYAAVASLSRFVIAFSKTFAAPDDHWHHWLNVMSDVSLLLTILAECAEAINPTRYSLPLPASVKLSLEACVKQQLDLTAILEEILPKNDDSKRARVFKRIMFSLPHQLDDMKKRYITFKESILLLRNLISDLRTRNEFQEMRGFMLEAIINDLPKHSDDTTKAPEAQPNDDLSHNKYPLAYTLESRASGSRPDGENDRKNKETQIREAASKVADVEKPKPEENKQRTKVERSFERFIELLQFDFKCTVILAIEQESSEGFDRWKFEPVVAVVDTGTNQNFINRKLLTDNNMDMSKVVPITTEDKIPRTLETLDTLFEPKEKITLKWRGDSDRVERKNTFIVVDTSTSFDVIIAMKVFLKDPVSEAAFPVMNSERPWKKRHRRTSTDDTARRKAEQTMEEELNDILALPGSSQFARQPPSATRADKSVLRNPALSGDTITAPSGSRQATSTTIEPNTSTVSTAPRTPSLPSSPPLSPPSNRLIKVAAGENKHKPKQKREKGKGKENTNGMTRERENKKWFPKFLRL